MRWLARFLGYTAPAEEMISALIQARSVLITVSNEPHFHGPKWAVINRKIEVINKALGQPTLGGRPLAPKEATSVGLANARRL